MLIDWLSLAACAAAIYWAGVRLSLYAELFASRTGLSQGWIGLLLLSTVTSLPELVTGLSSVTVADTPDIAVGDVLGSCVFNLAILVLIDVIFRKDGSLFSRASQGHILSASFGIVLLGLVAFSILSSSLGAGISLFHVGPYTPLFLGIYLLAMHMVFKYERAQYISNLEERSDDRPELTRHQLLLRISGVGIIIVLAGMWLPFIGGNIADALGWRDAFVGTLLIAAATSAPEVSVSLAAVRMGALNMAIANILGSNLFNIVILSIDDVAYTPGPLLASISPAHAVSAISAMLMTATTVIGLFYRHPNQQGRNLHWLSAGMGVIFLVNAWLLFQSGEAA